MYRRLTYRNSQNSFWQTLSSLRAILLLGALLVTQLGCKPGMDVKDADDDEDADEEQYDPGSIGIDIPVDDSGEPMPNAGGNSPNTASSRLNAAKVLETEIIEKIRKARSTKKYTVAQIKLLEKHLADVRRSFWSSKKSIETLRAELKGKIDEVLKWSGAPTNVIKCHKCTRRMNVDRRMLLHMNGEVFGGGTWSLCDEYGNTKPGTSYPSLGALLNAHPNSSTHHVHSCVYCYKDDAISSAERAHTNARREFERIDADRKRHVERANGAETAAIKTLKYKRDEQRKEVDKYESIVSGYANAAAALRDFRENAIVDYINIPYEEYSKYGKCTEREGDV